MNITSNGSDVFASAESKDPDNDQIWDFPILLRATDNAGNQIVTTVTDYVIKLDPGGDRPRVTVSYPDEPGKTLGGTIRVYGLATDDDAVNSVYMQVDDTGDGVADTDSLGTDWYNGGLGQPVTGSANWYRIINQSGEFDPVSGTNTIHIRARGQDIYGTYGAWTAWQEIIIDKNVPQFGSQSDIALDPDATPASGNEDVYAVGMWVNGATVYLRGSITDDGGITAIEVDGSVSGSLALNPTWFTAGYSGTGYDMAIPITLDAGASGVKQLTITAYDNSATPRESVFEVRFNFDNQAPTATLNAAASPAAVAQSDGWYKVKGTALDDGSDIDRVEVYFVRRGDGSTTFDRIYNPGQTNTWALLSSVDFTDNYPTLQGTASRGTEFTLTHAALANNKLIAVGQKILVGPELRTISDYDSATGLITWADGTVLTSETSYTIRLGLQVDHKDTIETSAVAQGTVDRSAGQEKTLVDPALSSNTDISVGDTLKINGEYRIIDTWTPGTGTITWTGLDVAVGAGQAYEVYSVLNDDIDHYVEYLKQTSGIEYTWSVDIKSDAIPDGPIEIHYVAFDTAGNRTHYQTAGYKVQNNGPRVGAIVLGSDLDGNGSVDPLTETVQYEYDSDTALTETKAFALTVKDGPMYIEPVVTNGNGDLHLWMTGAHTLSDYALRTAGTVDPIEVIDDAELAAMGDGSRTFTMAIWDETEETEPNVDSLSITRGATVTVDYVDGVKPHAAIRPFYWNDEDDNSLFENSRDNGHIEITGVTLYGTSDPDVSGKISVRGVAYDDQRITAIYAYMDGYTFTGGTTKTIGAYTYTLLSTYSGGSWTDVDQWATNGWKATVTDAGIGQDGHRISWQLDIDTGNSTNFASLADTDRFIRVVVEDRAVSPSLETATASTLTGTGTRPAINSIVVTPDPDIKPGQLVVLGSGDQAYASRISSYDAGTIVFASAVDQAITAYTIYLDGHQNPLYQVDVVPYITSIVRASNSTRSRLGKYPLRNSEANVIVSGFNLFTSATQDTDNWIRIYSAATAGNSDADALVIEAAPAPSTSSFEMTMNANSNSGWFRLSVNGIEAINNIDDNAKEWNKETDPSNAASTAAWTDDRYLMLFRTGDSFRESLDPEYVSMSFDSDLNRLVGQWSNSGYASTYYGTPVADGNTRISVFSTYDPPTWTDVFVDTDGDIHSLYLDDSTNGGGDWGYLRTEINNGSIGYIEVLGDDDESTPNSADGMDEKLHQFRNARIAVRSGTNDQYISYYDYYAKCLKYSRVINGTETFVSDYHRTDSATVVDGNDYFTLNPVPALDVGMWSDIQVDDIGGTDTTTWRPVIVYYDNTNEKLKLARGESSQPNGTADWTLQDVDVASTTGVNEGQYLGSGSLSMKMDAAGNLHIVTRNGLEGGLYYIYADNIDGTGTYVFEPPVCIDPQTADGTWADITLNGNSPMVSYKNGTSYKGLKYAYVASGTGLSSSDWEYMIVPSATAVADQRTNIEYTASATDFPYDGNVAFGYAASNFQIIYLRRQVP
ncbi:MAG: hypothetical protein KBB32_08520 [Spirochaetia bacterium]|nr:hypothetical protein [Spirochaetia bacterium]